MGDIYKGDDYHIELHLEGLNLRFSPGPPLREMVKLQKEFEVFSDRHALQDSIALLNVTAASWELRNKWHRLLGWIASLDSNLGTPAGPTIVGVLKQNLEARDPRPVHFMSHDHRSEKRVIINTKGDRVTFYIDEVYLTISMPLRKKGKALRG
jgi:hypothetical protein